MFLFIGFIFIIEIKGYVLSILIILFIICGILGSLGLSIVLMVFILFFIVVIKDFRFFVSFLMDKNIFFIFFLVLFFFLILVGFWFGRVGLLLIIGGRLKLGDFKCSVINVMGIG